MLLGTERYCLEGVAIEMTLDNSRLVVEQARNDSAWLIETFAVELVVLNWLRHKQFNSLGHTRLQSECNSF